MKPDDVLSEQKEAAENDRYRIQLALDLTDEEFDQRFYLTHDFLWEAREKTSE